MGKKRKGVLYTSYSKIVTGTKVADGKTVTETTKTVWRDKPKDKELDWRGVDRVMRHLGKAMDEIGKQMAEDEE